MSGVASPSSQVWRLAGMNKNLKLPFALRAGELVHISTVESGRQPDCVCPGCKQPLVAKKGTIKQHHFAHDSGSQCNLESALHWIGKTLIHTGIQTALKEGKPINLRWHCSECDDTHEANLLKQTTVAKLECHLGVARPDVLLADSDDKPVTVIEVIVSHPPEDAARSFYEEAGIPVVEVRLDTYDALDALRDLSVLRASAVSICTRPKCDGCGRPLSAKMVHVVDGDCYRCGGVMKISFADVEGYCYDPSQFSKRDTEVAEQRGCILREQFSKTVQESYVANTCGGCGAFTGSFYLHDFYHLADDSTGTVTGLYCTECEKHFD